MTPPTLPPPNSSLTRPQRLLRSVLRFNQQAILACLLLIVGASLVLVALFGPVLLGQADNLAVQAGFIGGAMVVFGLLQHRLGQLLDSLWLPQAERFQTAVIEYERLIRNTADLSEILTHLSQTLAQVLYAGQVWVWLYHQPSHTLVLTRHEGPALSDPLLELPLDLTASELKSGSPAALPEGSLRQSLLSLGVEAVAVMHLQDEIIGLVGLGGQVLGQGYRQAGLLLLERMAGHSALAVKQARLIADLEDSVSKLELAYRRTVEAQEEERRSLAVEIHDDILGRLTTMSVTLRNCRNFMLKKPEQVQEWLAHVEEETQDINHRLREITQGLYPSVLNDLGLISALEAYLDTLASKPWPLTAPKAITLTAQGFQGVRLDDERLERDVYSLTRQALDNAIKHAEAEQVFIHLQRQNEGLSVTVQDTGKGLRDDPAVLMGQNGRLGLLSMQERVRAWQGTVNFSSEAGKGTTVRAFIPCEMENQASNSLQMFNQYLNRVAD